MHLVIPESTQLTTMTVKIMEMKKSDQDTGLEELPITLVRQCKSIFLQEMKQHFVIHVAQMKVSDSDTVNIFQNT